MLQEERRRLILELLEEQGSVTVTDLCERFTVSDMTIRRDLRDLGKKGLVRRIHGGAVSNLSRGYEPPYQLRVGQQIDEKRAIGMKAAEFIGDGDIIGLDFGSTTLEIVKFLEEKRDLTIVTASLLIANEIIGNLSLSVNIRLILTGGVVRTREMSMQGNYAEEAFKEFHVDKAFIGVGGLSLNDGLTDYNVEDAQIKRALINSSKHSIVVLDHTKLERTKFASIVPLSRIDAIITDSHAPQDVVKDLREAGVTVTIA